MLGLMQNWPLLAYKIIDYAAQQHPRRKVVSRSIEGPIVETNYAQLRNRALKVAQRLVAHGIRPGDRVATLAWNTARHLECWYGIMGAGAVYHTVNPRLFKDQIAFIINHAEDRLLLLDTTFVPLVESVADQLPTIERYVILTDKAGMPKTALINAVAYEDWLAEADGNFSWVEVDENDACGMCYTSGTTGEPKGVVYSHRSNVLHSLIACMSDNFRISSRDVALMVVPMFHANSWSLAFSALMTGATLVLPGSKLDGASIYELLEKEKVTFSAAVPTVWLMLLQYLEANNLELPLLERVIIGGSACPRAMTKTFADRFGVDVIHAWGMTEMSPLGTFCSLKPETKSLEIEAQYDLKMKQGHPPFGVEMKIADDEGRPLPWDGKAFGRLKVRGPAVSSAYFKGAGGNILDDDGFFDTGDVATVDEFGYMQIVDRSKDVIKSGGEWISSIDIENIAVGHPDVAEAAVIGVRHPKWDERPLLIIVPKKDRTPTKQSVLAFLEGKIAKWWMPDDMVLVQEIPHTATGKILKTALRDKFSNHVLPTAQEPAARTGS
ncbi:MAG: long-chain-fatty-acid--CoA ligase [Hyphomicrobiales bacterium]|nr:long-chain-fatty-acid--CoA ligase [Hyphomicrobiales bacterium]